MASKLSVTSKRLVAVGLLIGGLVLLYVIMPVLPPFILAAVVAYILNPLVDMVMRRTRWRRSTVVAVLYLLLVLALVLAIVLVTPTLIRQIRSINVDVDSMAAQVRRWLDDYRQIQIGEFTVDVQDLTREVRGAIQSGVTFLAQRTGGLVFNVLSGLAWLILILLVSFYLLRDGHRFRGWLLSNLPESYHADVLDLEREINTVLGGYLRGQVVLGLVVGIATGVALAIVGVRNALLLGILAGVLEVVPNLGPILAAIPAVAIAFFQGSTHLPIDKLWFALLVAGIYVVIQQVENHFLVPRIIGASVHLHPVIVILAILTGAGLAGVMGALLAVPATAVGRILVSYVVKRLQM